MISICDRTQMNKINRWATQIDSRSGKIYAQPSQTTATKEAMRTSKSSATTVCIKKDPTRRIESRKRTQLDENKSTSSQFKLIQVRYKLIIIGKQNRISKSTLPTRKHSNVSRFMKLNKRIKYKWIT